MLTAPWPGFMFAGDLLGFFWRIGAIACHEAAGRHCVSLSLRSEALLRVTELYLGGAIVYHGALDGRRYFVKKNEKF